MLAVAGGKGGTGKTTTALGLAAALARRGADPIVADADRAMPNLHVAADTPATPDAAALASGRPLEEVTHPSPRLPGVSVLPTTPGTDERAVGRALSRLADSAGTPTLLDCPAGAGRDAALPLRFADRTLLVSTARRASLADAAKTAAMARALDAAPVGCVLTRIAEPSGGIERLLGCPVVACVPPSEAPMTAPSAREAFERLSTLVDARNV